MDLLHSCKLIYKSNVGKNFSKIENFEFKVELKKPKKKEYVLADDFFCRFLADSSSLPQTKKEFM